MASSKLMYLRLMYDGKGEELMHLPSSKVEKLVALAVGHDTDLIYPVVYKALSLDSPRSFCSSSAFYCYICIACCN